MVGVRPKSPTQTSNVSFQRGAIRRSPRVRVQQLPVAACCEKLRRTDADVTLGHTRQHRPRQLLLAVNWLSRRKGSQRPRGRDAEHSLGLLIDFRDRDVNRLKVRATVQIHWPRASPQAGVCADRGRDELFGCFHSGNQAFALCQSRRDCG
jgi:hypothetical protein